MATETYQKLIEDLHRSDGLGVRTTANGVVLIGHVPHIAPEAWLHAIYPALTDKDLDILETNIQRSIPNQLREFYLKLNGLSMFSGSLSIYGKRGLNVRSGDQVWQPFNLATPNTIERPKDADADAVFFGGLRKDGSQYFMKKDQSIVYHCERWKARAILTEWENLPTMLLSEYSHLTKLFDEKGVGR